MPKADIVITQTTPRPVGQAGKSARGLDLHATNTEPIVFTNSDDGHVGAVKYEWSLLESPPGSVAVLSGANTRTAELEADVYGRYVVQLRVNDMGDDTPGSQILVASVSFPSLGTASWGDELCDWDLPAFSEATYANWQDYYSAENVHGAQQELWRILYQLRSGEAVPLLGGGGGGGVDVENGGSPLGNFDTINFTGAGVTASDAGGGKANVTIPGGGGGGVYPAVHFPLSSTPFCNQQSAYSVGFWTIVALMRPLDFASMGISFTNVQFGAVIADTGSARIDARLYNITDSEVVTNSLVNVIGTPNPTNVVSSVIPVGVAPGDLKTGSTKMYRVEILLDVSSFGNGELYDAYFLFS